MRKSLLPLFALALCGQAEAQPLRNLAHRVMYGPSAPGACDVSATACANGVCTTAQVSTPAMPVPMTAANVAAARTNLFYDIVRLHVAREAVKKGSSRVDAHAAAASLTNAVIDARLATMKVPLGAWGDGHIIQAIIDFLNSPIGQMLINFLLSLLGL